MMEHPYRPSRRSNRGTPSGSENALENSSEPEFLIVGQIIRPHGVRGEVAMKIMTDYPERLSEIETLYVGPHHQPLAVSRLRRTGEGILIQFEEIDTREQAEPLRGLLVHISRADAVPLGDGEVYLFQLQGIRVITDAGEELGRLTGLIETGANDVYEVTGEQGRELLLPAIPEVIRHIDVRGRVMTVHLLDGLR